MTKTTVRESASARRGAFISYRQSDDGGRALSAKSDLERLLRIRVFVDVHDTAAGATFLRVIDETLACCGVVLAFIGTRWLDEMVKRQGGEDFVHYELSRALADPQVTVIPVLIDGARLPSRDLLPPDLRRLPDKQAVSLRHDRWKDDIQNLAAELVRLLRVWWRWQLRGLAAGALAASLLAGYWLWPSEIGTLDPPLAVAARAFADRATVVSGDTDPPDPDGDVSSQVADDDYSTFVSAAGADTRISVEFSDNAIVNGPGYDLVVLEYGSPQPFTIDIEGHQAPFEAPTPIGMTSIRDNASTLRKTVNARFFDLTEFGVPSDHPITTFLWIPDQKGVDLIGAAALHSVDR